VIRPGSSTPLGAIADDEGVNFALFSSVAEAVELCLFDEHGTERRMPLPGHDGDVWHGYLPGCRVGQRYGYRVHGRYAPDEGLRCNPHKLLLDPYARALAGEFAWHEAVHDFATGADGELVASELDSAGYVPKAVVTSPGFTDPEPRPRVPWAATIFYEANVRGFTMQHPAISDAERGTFTGMKNAQVLAYLKALGVSSLELMPVHAFIDEAHLARRGLRNFWGYNSISFFAPAPRYAISDGVAEFRDMLRAIHDAGLEVILDVVYNHTGEGDGSGPTLGFRGIDNLAYYSTEPGRPGVYINDTGCGNTINSDHPRVRELVLDSLAYWHRDMGVDGFRFDLAPVLGRHNHGFSPGHPTLEAINSDPRLRHAKLVAEPWDPGPGGYQLGAFPAPWAEWNDRYRDAVRRFWRGDAHTTADLARHLRGSAEIFEASGRSPTASVNFVCSHDGFTLTDVVSFEHRHNEANGEDNRDGHAHNYSTNHGVEGRTGDAAINAARRRQRLNMLATLLLSQGTPLLLAGDEFGNSQRGNNNAYAQDNGIGWLDWSGVDEDPEFTQTVRDLIRLRQETPLLHLPAYVHGKLVLEDRLIRIDWLRPDGRAMTDEDWSHKRVFGLVLSEARSSKDYSAFVIAVNGGDSDCFFQLPELGNWQCVFASGKEPAVRGGAVQVSPDSIACVTLG
jgi:glycogen operon protein